MVHGLDENLWISKDDLRDENRLLRSCGVTVGLGGCVCEVDPLPKVSLGRRLAHLQSSRSEDGAHLAVRKRARTHR
mgnify:CR=1 FL=1